MEDTDEKSVSNSKESGSCCCYSNFFFKQLFGREKFSVGTWIVVGCAFLVLAIHGIGWELPKQHKNVIQYTCTVVATHQHNCTQTRPCTAAEIEDKEECPHKYPSTYPSWKVWIEGGPPVVNYVDKQLPAPQSNAYTALSRNCSKVPAITTASLNLQPIGYEGSCSWEKPKSVLVWGKCECGFTYARIVVTCMLAVLSFLHSVWVAWEAEHDLESYQLRDAYGHIVLYCPWLEKIGRTWLLVVNIILVLPSVAVALFLFISSSWSVTVVWLWGMGMPAAVIAFVPSIAGTLLIIHYCIQMYKADIREGNWCSIGILGMHIVFSLPSLIVCIATYAVSDQYNDVQRAEVELFFGVCVAYWSLLWMNFNWVCFKTHVEYVKQGMSLLKNEDGDNTEEENKEDVKKQSVLSIQVGSDDIETVPSASKLSSL